MTAVESDSEVGYACAVTLGTVELSLSLRRCVKRPQAASSLIEHSIYPAAQVLAAFIVLGFAISLMPVLGQEVCEPCVFTTGS